MVCLELLADEIRGDLRSLKASGWQLLRSKGFRDVQIEFNLMHCINSYSKLR